MGRGAAPPTTAPHRPRTRACSAHAGVPPSPSRRLRASSPGLGAGRGSVVAVDGSVGRGASCPSAVGRSFSLPLLSADPFFLPQSPSGGLKFTAVSHSSFRCGRKRPSLKGRRQERGAGKRKAAWSGAACLPSALVPPTLHGERVGGDGGEGSSW